MTTAARPTWTPAMGGLSIRDTASHPVTQSSVYDIPAHTKLKIRQPGQNTEEELRRKNLKEELEKAEKEYREQVRRKKGIREDESDRLLPPTSTNTNENTGVLSIEEQRQKILDEARNSASGEEDSAEEDESSDSDQSEDDTEELMRELERIKREKAEEKRKIEELKEKEDSRQKDEDILQGNPLLAGSNFSLKRRWDDDVVFRKQAEDVDYNPKKRFVNDLLRSDFHRKFMNKYIK